MPRRHLPRLIPSRYLHEWIQEGMERGADVQIYHDMLADRDSADEAEETDSRAGAAGGDGDRGPRRSRRRRRRSRSNHSRRRSRRRSRSCRSRTSDDDDDGRRSGGRRGRRRSQSRRRHSARRDAHRLLSLGGAAVAPAEAVALWMGMVQAHSRPTPDPPARPPPAFIQAMRSMSDRDDIEALCALRQRNCLAFAMRHLRSMQQMLIQFESTLLIEPGIRSYLSRAIEDSYVLLFIAYLRVPPSQWV